MSSNRELTVEDITNSITSILLADCVTGNLRKTIVAEVDFVEKTINFRLLVNREYKLVDDSLINVVTEYNKY